MDKFSVELSDRDIIDIEKKIKLPPLTFIGTKDMLHLVDDYKDKFFIINLDNSSQNGGSGGTHWVCLSTYANYPIYFDSYAVLPPEIVEKWIKQRYDKFFYWNKQIQSVRATYCGWVCVMFLHFLYYNYILKQKSFFDFVNKFEKMFNTDDQTKNYKVILKYFSKIM